MKTTVDELMERTMTPKGITALSDGIFAIIMTLLVLEIKIPAKEHLTREELHTWIYKSIPVFETYIYTFLLLGIFWVILHRHFYYIKKVDNTLLWINLFLLMFICIIPFSSDLAGEWRDFKVSKIIFSFNLFLVIILKSFNWWYATKNHRLVSPDLSNKYIAFVNRQGLFMILGFMVAFILAAFNLSFYKVVYLTIPMIMYFDHKKTIETSKNTDEIS